GTLDVVGISLLNSGSFNPGAPTGILSVKGDYPQDFDGSLGLEIGGTTAGVQFDRLDVTGTAFLDGAINVKLANGFAAKIGYTFNVFNFGSRVGDFTFWNGLNLLGLNLRLEPHYSTNSLTLITVPLSSPNPTLGIKRKGSDVLVFWPTEF